MSDYKVTTVLRVIIKMKDIQDSDQAEYDGLWAAGEILAGGEREKAIRMKGWGYDLQYPRIERIDPL